MGQELGSAIQILEAGHRVNKRLLIGLGAFLALLGVAGFFYLDPSDGLPAKAFLGRYLLGPLGIGVMLFAALRRPKPLAVLRDRPEHIVGWSIRARGQTLPLVLTLRDGSTVTQDLNVDVARKLTPILEKALPRT